MAPEDLKLCTIGLHHINLIFKVKKDAAIARLPVSLASSSSYFSRTKTALYASCYCKLLFHIIYLIILMYYFKL